MAENIFFEASKEQSRVKAVIVSKYFEAWANVIMSVQDRASGNREKRIVYLDLFAGPGRYDDGTKSTPLLILEKAIANQKLRERLVTIFNDRERNNTKSLQMAIENLPGVEKLRFKPQVFSEEIGSEIVKIFAQRKLFPTFFFVDPWGYKGLSLGLIDSVLKDWGCDCVFFFNYNRINMGLQNAFVKEHMDALFGEKRADELRRQLAGLQPHEREPMIIEALCQAIKATGKPYVLPFRFKSESGARTSHHLIFVSKDFRGYEIMKDVMWRESSTQTQGVASFEYNPTSELSKDLQPLLFQLSQPLDDLGETLLHSFAGGMLTMAEVYEQHNIDTPYVKKNYKEVLIKLEAAAKIVADPPAAKRRKGTMGDGVKVTFPARYAN
jgi:three-Cys-motif partner protein